MQKSTRRSARASTARREQLQRVARHRAIMARALDRIFERAVLLHRRERGFEIALRHFALLQRAPPEFALAFRAAAERQHDRQGDLAFAEIVADILAELGRGAAVVERVVDQLEGDAEIDAIAAAGGDLRLRPLRRGWPDFASGGEQRRRLGADDLEIGVLGRLRCPWPPRAA